MDESTPAPFAPAPISKPAKFVSHSPVWVLVVRGFQALMSFIILVISGVLIQGLVLPELVFALVCGLFSCMAIAYSLVTEKVAGCRGAYSIWIVVVVDGVLALFWFAACIAVGVLRGTFVYRVNPTSCFNNGNAVNSNHCINKRAAAADEGGLAMMSAVAGLSALAWLLFVATTVYHGHMFRMHNQGRAKTANVDAEGGVEGKGQHDPMLPDENGPQYQQPQQYEQYQQPQQYEQYNTEQGAQQGTQHGTQYGTQEYQYEQYGTESYPQYSETNQYSSQVYPSPVQQPAQTHQTSQQ